MKTLLVFFISIFSCVNICAQQKNDLLFVFLNKRKDLPAMEKEASDKLMKGHMANIEKLAKEGKLLVAGPFDGGGGIFILNTTSIDEAKLWLAADPGIQAERWRVEFLPVQFKIGAACKAKEPYEMVSYHFIRYGLTLTKFNVQEASQTLKKHIEYMNDLNKTGNIIAEASFGEKEGSILIMKGELDQRVVEASPAVQAMLFEIDIRKLWIAKGSFCEQ